MTTTLISSFDNESITEVMGYEVLTTAAACRSCKNCEISVPATSTITLHRDELKREVSIFLKLIFKSWLCQKKIKIVTISAGFSLLQIFCVADRLCYSRIFSLVDFRNVVDRLCSWNSLVLLSCHIVLTSNFICKVVLRRAIVSA
jgi:hypothetical protein